MKTYYDYLSVHQSAAPAVDAIAYRSIVSSLRYLVNTRPDLAYSVGYVSRFMKKPTTEHLAAVKRVLRYIIAGTLDYIQRLLYKKGEEHTSSRLQRQ